MVKHFLTGFVVILVSIVHDALANVRKKFLY